ncbi:MAG: hypothetical protein ACRBHB_22320 [Arenicella sp.]
MDLHLKTNLLLPTALLTLASSVILAGEADVIKVEAKCQTTCTFHVTLEHADTGWEHYANKWDVLTPDGKVIATRVLHHPHVNEQPFTRSLSNVTIPQGVQQVEIRAHDSQHEYGGKTIIVDLDL